MRNVDITIVGAGSAGLTLALLLSELPLQIALVEKGPAPEQTKPEYRRVSALNLASQRVLEKVGVWQGVAATAAAYQHMQVWEADSFARIGFDAASEQLTALGWICDNEQIRQQLLLQSRQRNNIHCFFDAEIRQLEQSEREVLLSLDGELLLTKLVVGADGVNSYIRQQQQMPLTHWDYDHQALVTVINTAEPHNHTARQVFLPEGPLALLPLPDPHQCSIVWSTSPQRAAELQSLSPDAFGQALTVASQSVLGLITAADTCQCFPLRMRYAADWVKGRVVLVADAAHSIHPLAGQGMNLGLMDVAALAELIGQQISAEKDFSDPRILRQYERWRKAEAQIMIAAMELFKRGFTTPQPFMKLVRGLGMKAFDQVPFLKRTVINAALGNSGDLPLIARPATGAGL